MQVEKDNEQKITKTEDPGGNNNLGESHRGILSTLVEFKFRTEFNIMNEVLFHVSVFSFSSLEQKNMLYSK